MKRKDAIKTLIMASGAAVTLPSWALNWNSESLPDLNPFFTDQEISVISSVVDTILPSNGTIGALSVGTDKFLIGLIGECYEEEFRGEIRAQLYSLNANAMESNNLPFNECDFDTRISLLRSLESSTDETERAFFTFIKEQSIRGFETSEEVMVNYHGYVMMPGFYDGNVDVEN